MITRLLTITGLFTALTLTTSPANAMNYDRYCAIKARIARTTMTLTAKAAQRARAAGSPRAGWYRREYRRAAAELSLWSG